MTDDSSPAVAAQKAALRAPLLRRRRKRTAGERQSARDRISEHLTSVLRSGATVAAYLALPSEPLDPATVKGWAARMRVLVPVVTGTAPLDWCLHRADAALIDGPAGIPEPDSPRLGPAALATAEVILLPALTVDRHGYRLGRGGGHYDRSLALVRRLGGTPRLIAVVYDDELTDSLPHDEWDVPVTDVVTPEGGLQRRVAHPAG